MKKLLGVMISLLLLSSVCYAAPTEVGGAGTVSVNAGTNASALNDGSLGAQAYLITGWIKFDLGTAYAVQLLKFYSHDNITYALDDYGFEGSNDDSSWTAITTISNMGMSLNTWHEETFTNTTNYRYYRFNNIVAKGEASVYMTEIELWGEVLSGSTFTPKITWFN